MPAVTNLDK